MPINIVECYRNPLLIWLFMSSSKWHLFFSWATVVSIALTFAISPLIYSTKAFLVFDIPKLVLIQSGIELAFAFFMLAMSTHSPKEFSWRRPSWPTICLIIYLLSACISTATAFSPHQAWWGSTYRRQGLMLLLHDVALFWMVRSLSRKRVLRLTLLAGVLAGGIGLIIMTLLEYWNIPAYSAWKSAGAYAGRLVGPFGQPNYTAAYLGMVLPLFLAAAVTRTKSSKMFALAAVPLLLIGLWGTGSRSTWIGIGCALLMVALFTLYRRFKAHRLTIVALLTGTALLYLTGFVILVSQNSLSWRVAELLHPERWDQIERFQIWDRSLALIDQRPLTGYGLDNLELVFPGSLRPTDTHLMTVYVDRAHSHILDQALSVGVLGMIAWFALLGLTTLQTLRQKQGDKYELWRLACAAGVLLYALRGAVDMGNITLDALLWLYLALCLRPEEHDAPEQIASGQRTFRMLFIPVLSALLAGILCLAGIAANYRILQADSFYKNGLRQESADPAAAASLWLQAITSDPHVELYRLKLADLALRQGYGATQPADQNNWYSTASAALLDWDRKGGESADFLYRLGQLYQYGQDLVSPDWRQLSQRSFERAHLQSPFKFASP